MISTHLTGNFGDHIIRYALARTVAEKKGYQWGINPIPSHDYYGGQEQMGFFHLDYGLPNNAPYGTLPEGVTNQWREAITRYKDYNFFDFQPDIFFVEDNTELIIYCGQDARYYDRQKLIEWFTIGEVETKQCEDILNACDIKLDENLTVINCRGGEYKGVSSLLLQPIYYKRAIDHVLAENPYMKFIVITDDVPYYRTLFSYPVFHFSILGDYYVINNAKNLIISNSGFALFPAWLNKNKPKVIAPMHWARHNLGYWANSSVWTFAKEDNWTFIDRNGNYYEYHEALIR